MADPTKYDVAYSFSGFQASNPSRPLPADRVDIELANIETSIDEIVDAVRDVRRSDGAVQNGAVSYDSLGDDVKAIIGSDGSTTTTTSTSTQVVGLGAKSFTVQAGKVFRAGTPVVISSTATPTTNYMAGFVTSYSGTTLAVDVTSFSGSGSISDWVISVSGVPGAPGAQGPAGAGTGDMLKSENLSGLANIATARGNLGLGALATLNVPANNSITTAMLANEAVTAAKIASGVVVPYNAPGASTSATIELLEGTSSGTNKLTIKTDAALGFDIEFTIPSPGGVACMLDITQTLLNKTLVTPTINQGNLVGTTTNDDAAAGSVGEYVENIRAVGSALALTSGSPLTVASIPVTAGDWDVQGLVQFFSGGTTTSTLMEGVISLTNNSATPAGVNAVHRQNSAGIGTNPGHWLPVGTTRIKVATTTTVYLVANSTFATSTMSAYGQISARRRR